MLGVFFFFTVIVLTSSTDVEQCSPHLGNLPIHANLEGCTTMPCNLPRLSEAVINVQFQAHKFYSSYTIRDMRTIAQVTALGDNLNYTLGEHQYTCNHLQNTYCPILKGEVIDYIVRMLIEWWMPAIGASVEFFVLDDNAIPIWCLLLRIQVTGS